MNVLSLEIIAGKPRVLAIIRTSLHLSAPSNARKQCHPGIEETICRLGSGTDSVFNIRRCAGMGLQANLPVQITLLGYGAGNQFFEISAL